MTQVTPSADVKNSKTNITSANVVFGKRSDRKGGGVELESMSSDFCFDGGCSYQTTEEYANCPDGAYVYQITGYSGSNLDSTPAYATQFDIVCSDGSTATIGQTGSIYSSSKTIINPTGYTSVSAGGGCITDHIKIGGTDFGDAGFELYTCSSAPGLTFVGFGTLTYQPHFPSFAQLAIECDVACPKGTYYSFSDCYPCPPGIHI